MLYKISVRSKTVDAASPHLAALLPDLQSWHDYYVEVDHPIEITDLARLLDAFANPVTQHAVANVPLPTNAVQVSYKRGIVDNESPSVLALCEMYGVHASGAKVATSYSSDDPRLAEIIESHACNSNIEELWRSEPDFGTLSLQGTYMPMRTYHLLDMSDDELAALGQEDGRSLDLDMMKRIREIQAECNLEYVTDVMLEALDARWSDHCSHTTWKSLDNLMGNLVRAAKATKNDNIVSMFKDNAGIWSFYDGWGIAIKGETHNGPSAVSAYFGQLTKLGGVLRDILGTGQGADPIGSFEYTATGLPEAPSAIAGRPAPKQIANETIRAIKEYGNTFGVPMMSSHMTFHPDYRAKPFALGGSIGVIPLERAKKGEPKPGDCAMLIGGLTGNDGIHGASGSSAGAVMDATSVQIGSPLEAIKFREAIIDLRDADCIRAITDLGAAGINSAFGELGEACGVWLNMALVPLKSKALPMWRILLSESQERMALAIPPDKLDNARVILARYEVPATVIGRFTDDDCYTVTYDESLSEELVVTMSIANIPHANEIGFRLPYGAMEYVPTPRAVKALPAEDAVHAPWPSLDADELRAAAMQVAADGEVVNQSYAAMQYDSSVQGRYVYGPLLGQKRVASGYTALRPVLGHPGAAVFTTAFNPWLFAVHPLRAAKQMYFAAVLRQVLTGVALRDICLCDNFYTPHLAPSWDAWLVAMVKELSSLSERFGTPFISGKDSSAGSVQTDEQMVHVPNAVFLSALGKVPDSTRLVPEVLQQSGSLLVRIGISTTSMAGTAFARVTERTATDVDDVAEEDVASLYSAIATLPPGTLRSARVISDGGVFAAAMLMSLASDVLGAAISSGSENIISMLFAEHRVGALVEVSEDALGNLPSDLHPVVIGTTEAGVGIRVNRQEIVTPELLHTWSTHFAEVLR